MTENKAMDSPKLASSWLDGIPPYTVPAVLIGLPLVIALACWLAPGIMYDHFVWPYYWGPIKADAMGLGPSETLDYHGVATHSGYNVINTSSWAILLGLCLLGLAQLLRRLKSTMDTRLILGATAWVVAGSLFHVMEDTGLFQPPLQYVFITPPIYLLFAAFGVAAFILGHWLQRIAKTQRLVTASAYLAILLGILTGIGAATWFANWNPLSRTLHPLIVLSIVGATWLTAHVRFQKRGDVDPAELVTILGGGAILLGLAYVVSYALNPWPNLGGAVPSAAHPIAFLAVALAALPVALLAAWAKWRRIAKPENGVALAFLQPINMLLVFSQMLDAFATALAIDGFGYDEKHVVSRGVIDAARNAYSNLGWTFGAAHPTFLGFVPVKLAISILVVYAIDVSGKDTARRQTTLIGLVKFAIIMVGLGPGLRDLTRLALGV